MRVGDSFHRLTLGVEPKENVSIKRLCRAGSLFLQRIVDMGLFLDAANAWHDLHDVKYILDIARKGEWKRLELTFLDEDFPHLAGMQYAGDVDFGIRKAEYYGERLIPALLTKRMDDARIEGSRNWERLSGRLRAILHLQATLDGEFKIVSFDKTKVRTFSRIDAQFVIKSEISDDIYFVFLDEKSGRYYCKSAFRKEFTDYAENQPVMMLLQKTKVKNDIADVLYTRSGYQPICD